MLEVVFVEGDQVLSPMAHDKYLKELRNDIDTQDNWRNFLNRETWADELFSMHENEKCKLKQQFQEWLDNEVNRNDIYTKCNISYAIEEGGDY